MLKFLIECVEIFFQHALYVGGVIMGSALLCKFLEKKGERT